MFTMYPVTAGVNVPSLMMEYTSAVYRPALRGPIVVVGHKATLTGAS